MANRNGRSKMDKRPYVRGNVVSNLRPTCDEQYATIDHVIDQVPTELWGMQGLSVKHLTAIVEFGVSLLEAELSDDDSVEISDED